MSTKYDAIVIGTGQSGPSLAAALAGKGMNVAIIERGLFGGTCVNTGCIPTKTLVASARAAYVSKNAGKYGVNIEGNITVDMKAVKERKDEVSGTSNKNIESWMRGTENLTVYEGHGRFGSDNTVKVGEETLEAEKIFINVGGRAFVPDFPGLEEINYFTNSNMMDVDFLPEHLVIIGGSYIGLEFAQMYRRFGSEVTIIEKGASLIGREDNDVSEMVKEIMENEGINIRLNAECLTVQKEPDGKISVGVDCNDGNNRVTGSNLLLAVGRTPNTHDLGLEHTGIETDERSYIKVNDKLETSVEGIWAIGDCNGRGAFTHTSYNDFEIVASNLLDNDPRSVDDRITCYGLFIDPPLGRVGMTEEQVRSSGRNALIGKRMMSSVGRARERSETYGFIKVIVDADSKEILGATILGIEGDEAIHCLIDVMYAKAPYTVISRAVHIHPTVSELIPTVLQNLEPFK